MPHAQIRKAPFPARAIITIREVEPVAHIATLTQTAIQAALHVVEAHQNVLQLHLTVSNV